MVRKLISARAGRRRAAPSGLRRAPRRERRRGAQRGLTLIELLVVMLVVAMASGLVVFNLPPAPSEAQREAERFAARIAVAGEQAIMSGSVIGMELEAGGYRFYRYDRGEWRDPEIRPLSPGRFPPDIAVDFTVLEPARRNEDEEQRRIEAERRNRAESGIEIPAPNVFFSPTGETTAFDIVMRSRRVAIRVSLDDAGALEGPVEDGRS